MMAGFAPDFLCLIVAKKQRILRKKSEFGFCKEKPLTKLIIRGGINQAEVFDL
jgi:hypothetical protein